MSQSASRFKSLAANGALVLVSLAIGVGLIEAGMRMFYPISILNLEQQADASDATQQYVADDVLGLRPVLGGGAMYNQHGVLAAASVFSATPGTPTMLFMGDSVTAYARVVNPMIELLKADGGSFLNGGVAGYDIHQEVEFFLRHQKNTQPDVIVHQLHINDLQGSRWVIRTDKVRLYSPRLKPVDINPWLYRHSQIYRFVLARTKLKYSKPELEEQALASLRRMRDYTRDKGIDYYLILFPSLEPLAKWSAYDKDSRQFLLTACRDLGLRVVDLQPLAERMLAAGIEVKATPTDLWHPNEAFGKEAASYILNAMPSLRDARRPRSAETPRSLSSGASPK